jgi:hypothetical protein
MDTENKYMVGVRGSQIAFVRGIPATMPKDEALLFAAWIVALADDGEKFNKVLAEVQCS